MQKQVIAKVILDQNEHVDTAYAAPVPTWLRENIGERGDAWNYHEEPYENDFEFYSEGDAELFLLQWKGQLPL